MQIPPLLLPWSTKTSHSQSIYPIFIPFAGCAKRCIFCAQHVQSGKKECTEHSHTQDVLDETAKALAKRAEHSPPPHIAFYGGTFTALPEKDFAACLHLAKSLKTQGLIHSARCSTRPDSITDAKLKALIDAGFDTVELGVQSFNNDALHAARRYYDENTILTACARIKTHGLTLGLQLMPGMPGVHAEIFLEDTHKALAAKADFLRFYPCQVIAGTELENLWSQGDFTPWDLTLTIETLSKAWLFAHLQHVPVIRMGLAPEKNLESHIVAGPRHEALGNLVQSEALYLHLTQEISTHCKKHGMAHTLPVQSLSVPRHCQGYFWGHKQSLVSRWRAEGVEKHSLHWHSSESIEILF